jgi:uncharacterized protein (DUF433 family)
MCERIKGEVSFVAKEIAPRIVVDPKIKLGKPVIKGTRVPVNLVIAKLGGGMTREQVMEEYGIEAEDVLAALRYAAHVVALEDIRVTT